MVITLDTPILGSGGNALWDLLTTVYGGSGAPEPVLDYLVELDRLCDLVGFDFRVLAAQSAHETDNWTSYWWKARLNPAGIGITGDPKQNEASGNWETGADAARAHVVHMCAYVDSDEAFTLWDDIDPRAYDPRWKAVFDAGYDGSVRVLNDLTGKWAVDPRYAEKIVEKANAIFKETTMPTYSTVIPGLPGGPLVTDYPVSTDLIIPPTQTLNRPGTKARKPRRSVQHGNGNPNALARADAIWAYNGAKDDQGRPTQTSFHATGDHTGVNMLVPADEITWQGADGNGPGNMNGFSYELSEYAPLWNNPKDRDRAIYIAADFMGRVAGARLGAENPEQHWDFNYNNPPEQRHNCPQKLRNTPGAWERYVAQWRKSKADELARMAGGAKPTASPIWWTPGDIGVQVREHDGAKALAMVGEVTAAKGLLLLTSVGGEKFGNLTAGDKAKIVGTYVQPVSGTTKSGKPKTPVKWVFLDIDGQYPRARWSSFHERFPTL